MPLPVGVTTATVTFGGDTGFDGSSTRVDLIFTPSAGLVHAASGQRLFPAKVRGRADFGVIGVVLLPHTNQAGLLDSAGNTVTSFHYDVTGTYTSSDGTIEQVTKAITLPVGQDTVDLDAIPDGPATPPTTAPGASVTSVAGLTGVISGPALVNALNIEGGGGGGGGGVPDDGSVSTPKLVDGAVTLVKLAANAVNSSKIVDGSIATGDLGDGQVTLVKLAANSVDSGKIVDGAIATGDLGDGQVTLTKLAAAVQTSLGLANTALQSAPVTSVATKTGAVVLVVGDIQGLGTALAGKSDTGHTHTSAAVTDFAEAAQDAVAAMLAQGTGIALAYDDAANTLTITGTVTDTDTTNAEIVRDTIGLAMIGVPPVTVTPNDAADTITISTTATVNATDAALRARDTHTGEQAISTITNLQTTLDGKALASHTHTATAISDSTSIGRNLVTAADRGVVQAQVGIVVSDTAPADTTAAWVDTSGL